MVHTQASCHCLGPGDLYSGISGNHQGGMSGVNQANADSDLAMSTGIAHHRKYGASSLARGVISQHRNNGNHPSSPHPELHISLSFCVALAPSELDQNLGVFKVKL